MAKSKSVTCTNLEKKHFVIYQTDKLYFSFRRYWRQLYTVWRKKKPPLKLAAELRWELCQVLTDYNFLHHSKEN